MAKAKVSLKSSKKKQVKIEFSIPERLKFIRENRKLTQAELAKMAKLTQSTIANIERGGKEPSLETLEKIAASLDIHVATLFSSDEVFVFDLIRLRRKYTDVNSLTPHLYMALGKVIQFARDIGYLK